MPSVTEPPSTLAVVLAAGGGRRFSGPTHKLLAPLPSGATVATHAIAAALASAIGPVIVVLGAVELELPEGVIAVHNPNWAEGQATSLAIAVAAAGRAGVEALVVGLADQPLVPPEAWSRVAASRSPIAVATYDDTGHESPRNPVRLASSVWSQLPQQGDRGARDLIHMHPELVERVPCPGSAADVDRLEDLTRLEQRWQSNSSTNSS